MSDDIYPGQQRPDMLDSEDAGARVNAEEDDMPIPIKPARNPRWERPVLEPQPVEEYEEDVAEILSEIQSVTAVAQLESRVDGIEHDIARMVAAHEEDSARLAGELSIMKSRIEDALAAVSATVEELRNASAAAEAAPAFDVPAPAPAIDQDLLKAEMRMARDEAIEAARSEAVGRLKQIRSEVETAIATARAEFQSSFAGLLQGIETGLETAREQAMREVEKMRERFEPEVKAARDEVADEAATLRRDLISMEETFSGALRAFASRLEGLQAQVSEASARQAAERASYNAGVQGVAKRVDALEARIAEGLARLSEGILRVAENVGSATTLQRRIAALETSVSELQNRPR